ncbi:MAG: hypothetical protein R3Y63_14870 [Eubacteriales bacterium]
MNGTFLSICPTLVPTVPYPEQETPSTPNTKNTISSKISHPISTFIAKVEKKVEEVVSTLTNANTIPSEDVVTSSKQTYLDRYLDDPTIRSFSDLAIALEWECDDY